MPSNCNQEQWRGSASTLTDCLCPFFSWSNVISWPTIPPPCHCLHPCSPSSIHCKWRLLSTTVSFGFEQCSCGKHGGKHLGYHHLWPEDSELSILFSLNSEALSRLLLATRGLLFTARQKHWWQDINFLKSVGLHETYRICPFCESHKPSVRP